MSEIDDLVAKGLIETVEPDRPMAEKSIDEGSRHLQHVHLHTDIARFKLNSGEFHLPPFRQSRG